MKVVSYELKNLEKVNNALYRKLWMCCYKKAYMKHLLLISPEEKTSQAHVLYDNEENICSWMTTTKFPNNEIFCMFWTPVKHRRKGYAKKLLKHVAKQMPNKKFSAYVQAKKLMQATFGNSSQYKAIYLARYLPNRLKHCASMRKVSLECKYENW